MDPSIPQATPDPAEDLEGARNTNTSDRDLTYRPPAPGSNTSFSAHSNLSLTSIPAKAKTALAKASPEGQLCVITRRKSHVECARILRPTTKSDELKKLEFSWGCKPGKLDLDDAENMIWLSPELHRCFDSRHWALVPSLELLDDVQKKVSATIWRRAHTHFKKKYPSERREYSYVQLEAGEEPIPRFDATVPGGATLHQSPFTTLPPILSHIHPYFVISNVAQKDIKLHPEPESESDEELPGYATLQGDEGKSMLERIRRCRTIYQLWMAMPHAAHLDHNNSLPTQSSRSGASSGGGSRQSGSKESGSKTSNRNNKSRKRRRVQDRAESASPLEDRWNIDGGNQCGDVAVPYWLKVENWLNDVEVVSEIATKPMEV
ncbi:unnamed protein product [Rhizoctonia solani]|uniref:HNH nuclease domain-containing protein n=1 Tax=Rhizoctonia solani TaxID=456999 RepID=A0A8H3CZC1_9AGAM|nr:unnamed protein product [Rhizoctonia solani]